MAQILIRQLEEDVKTKLTRRARRHGRSTEEEVREILRNAVCDENEASPTLGSRISARFVGIGLDHEIVELRGQTVMPAQFER